MIYRHYRICTFHEIKSIIFWKLLNMDVNCGKYYAGLKEAYNGPEVQQYQTDNQVN